MIVIWCQYDGCLSGHVGQTLLTHYRARNKVMCLLAGGNLESLGKDVHPDPTRQHSLYHPQEDVCIFFIRDGGAPSLGPYSQGPERYASMEQWIENVKHDIFAEYLYVYEVDDDAADADGEWYVVTDARGVAGSDSGDNFPPGWRLCPLEQARDWGVVRDEGDGEEEERDDDDEPNPI